MKKIAGHKSSVNCTLIYSYIWVPLFTVDRSEALIAGELTVLTTRKCCSGRSLALEPISGWPPRLADQLSEARLSSCTQQSCTPVVKRSGNGACARSPWQMEVSKGTGGGGGRCRAEGVPGRGSGRVPHDAIAFRSPFFIVVLWLAVAVAFASVTWSLLWLNGFERLTGEASVSLEARGGGSIVAFLYGSMNAGRRVPRSYCWFSSYGYKYFVIELLFILISYIQYAKFNSR